MTNLSWLVAMINPLVVRVERRTVRRGSVEGPELAALLFAGDLAEYRVMQRLPQVQNYERKHSRASACLRLIEWSVGAYGRDADPSVDDSVLRSSRIDLGLATATEVAMAHGESRRGYPQSALGRLEDLSLRLDNSTLASNEHSLLEGFVWLSAAFIAWDWFQERHRVLSFVDDALRAVDIDALPSISTRERSGVASQKAYRQTIEALLAGTESLRDATLEDGETVPERARIGIRRGVMRDLDHLEGALSKSLLRGRFALATQSVEDAATYRAPTNDEWILGVLLRAEHTGHTISTELRQMMGYVTFPEALREKVVGLGQSSLRQLRRGGDKAALTDALQALRVEGPAAAIALETSSLLRSTGLGGASITSLDCLVLQSGASLLGVAELRTAFEILLSRRATLMPVAKGLVYEYPGSRFESLWTTILRVATELGEGGRAYLLLLEDLGEILDAGGDEYLLSLSLGELDQSVFAESHIRDASEGWLGASLAQKVPHMSSRINDLLMLASPDEGISLSKGGLDLSAVVRLLNGSVARGSEFQGPSRQSVSALLSRELETIRSDAADDRFTVSAISVAELTVAYLSLEPDAEIWSNLLEFLVDQRVRQFDKQAAFERLARSRLSVPDDFVSGLARNSSGLLRTGNFHAFDMGMTPFPAALRAMACLGALDGDQALSLCGELLSGNGQMREEGARTLMRLVSHGLTYDWLWTCAIVCSRDSRARVRAYSGRTLARTEATMEAERAELRTERLRDLLAEFGLFVPTQTLIGLLGAPQEAIDPLRETLRGIAETHLDSAVRHHARRVLGSGSLDP